MRTKPDYSILRRAFRKASPLILGALIICAGFAFALLQAEGHMGHPRMLGGGFTIGWLLVLYLLAPTSGLFCGLMIVRSIRRERPEGGLSRDP